MTVHLSALKYEFHSKFRSVGRPSVSWPSLIDKLFQSCLSIELLAVVVLYLCESSLSPLTPSICSSNCIALLPGPSPLQVYDFTVAPRSLERYTLESRWCCTDDVVCYSSQWCLEAILTALSHFICQAAAPVSVVCCSTFCSTSCSTGLLSSILVRCALAPSPNTLEHGTLEQVSVRDGGR